MDFLPQIFENCSIVHPGLLATITIQLFFDRVSMGNINVFKSIYQFKSDIDPRGGKKLDDFVWAPICRETLSFIFLQHIY